MEQESQAGKKHAPEPLARLRSSHAAQVRICALHLARLPLGHLLGDIISVCMLQAQVKWHRHKSLLGKAS